MLIVYLFMYVYGMKEGDTEEENNGYPVVFIWNIHGSTGGGRGGGEGGAATYHWGGGVTPLLRPPHHFLQQALGQIFKDDVYSFSSIGYLLHDVYAPSIAGNFFLFRKQ